MIDERTEELASAYVLGALDPGEQRAFERQLDQDAELRRSVAELRAVTALVAGNATLQEPATGLRARMLLAFEEGAAPPRRSRPQSPGLLPWALAAGLALVCIVSLLQLHALRTRLQAREQRIEQLLRAADSMSGEDARLRQQVLDLQRSNELASMRIAVLSARLRADPKAVAVSVWDNGRQSGVVVVHHLKPPPPDRDYQLWIIDPHYATPVDAGLLRVDANGDGRVDFKARQPIQQASQFAVTEEVRGGSPVPTLNAMVLAGA